MSKEKKVNKKMRTEKNSSKASNRKGDSSEKEDFLEESINVSNKSSSENRSTDVGRETPKEVKEAISPTQEIDESLLVDEKLLLALNDSADLILECLAPGLKKDFHIACYKDFFMKDIGIYILGLLNRMYKTGDYYNPDIEPEWDRRVVGISKNLKCKYCSKLIENPKNINQIFCNNLCAKRYKEKDKTGVIFPNKKDLGTEAEQDEKDWEKEEMRLNIND